MRPILALTALLAAGVASAEPTFPSSAGKITVETIAGGLAHPWSLAFLPDGRMLVTERPGRLRIVTRKGQLSPPLGGVPKVFAQSQAGLMDVVLARDFERSHTVFVCYAEPADGGGRIAVLRARLVDDETPRLDSPVTIFRQKGPVSRGLNIIRITPDGAAPPDNPFVGRQNALPEIWAYGLRNAQGLAFNPADGKLWEQEHGPMGGDEINIIEKGKNYGWPLVSYGRNYDGTPVGKGKATMDGVAGPLWHWTPSIAPSGMAFYTGDLYPGWKGSLFNGALKFELISRLELKGDKAVKEERMLQDLHERIRDVRQGPDGALYLLTDNASGRILRLAPAR